MSSRFSISLAAVFLISLPANGQIYKLRQPGGGQSDQFGAAVAARDGRVVVGASGADDCGVNSGATYVFGLDATTNRWTLDATLKPDDCAPGIFFGRKLDVYGNRIIVTATPPAVRDVGNAAAYIFRRDSLSGKWLQETKLVDPGGSEGRFASDVAISDSVAVVSRSGDVQGGRYEGDVGIYRWTKAGTWVHTQTLVGSGGIRSGVFGGAVALDDGFLAVASSAYLTKRDGSVYMFEENSQGDWEQVARFGGLEDFEVALDLDDDRLIVGDSQQRNGGPGSATIFVRDNGTWVLEQSLKPSSPYELGSFGAAVTISDDRALVVGYDEQLQFDFNIDRVVYVFGRSAESGRWEQQHVIDVGSVFFGLSVALDGRTAVIGEAGQESAGSAFVVHIH